MSKKITELPAVTGLVSTDLVPVCDVSALQTQAATIAQLVAAALPGSDTYVFFNDGGAFGADAGIVYDKTNDILTLAGAIKIGSGTMPTSGLVRVGKVASNTNAIRGVTSATVEAPILEIRTTDYLYLGDRTNWNVAITGVTLDIWANSTGYLEYGASGTAAFSWNSSGLSCALPVGGYQAGSVPFQFKRASISVTGTFTLSAAQYECVLIDLSNGGVAGAFDAVCPNVTGATFNIKNNTGQTCTVKKSGGAGVAVNNANTRWVAHNSSDYEQRHI